MGYASCYSLDLYCDNDDPKAHFFGEFPHQYQGETFGEVARAARKDGWIFKRDRQTVLCPKCRKVRLPPPTA